MYLSFVVYYMIRCLCQNLRNFLKRIYESNTKNNKYIYIFISFVEKNLLISNNIHLLDFLNLFIFTLLISVIDFYPNSILAFNSPKSIYLFNLEVSFEIIFIFQDFSFIIIKFFSILHFLILSLHIYPHQFMSPYY